jgi:hypothetical protein
MSLTKVSYSMIEGASFNVLDYGAVADGTISPLGGTDNGPAFRAAILAAAQAGGGTVVIPFGTYRVTSTVIMSRQVLLEGNSSFIVGPGIGSATDLFQSGYYNGTAVVTNIGTAPESQATNFSIKNLIIYYCGKAFNFYNVLDGSVLSQINFNDCTYAMYLDRCFYATFNNITSRGSASSAANAAVVFQNVNNVMDVSSMFVEGRTLGVLIAGGSNALKLYNCSFEGCGTGCRIENETGPIAFDTCYFETNSVVHCDIDTVLDKEPISFTNCFFNFEPIAIKGPTDATTRHRIVVDSTNRFILNTVNVNFGTNTIYNNSSAQFSPPSVDAGYAYDSTTLYDLAPSANFDSTQIFYDSSTALPIIKSKIVNDTLIAFHHEGGAGSVAAGANSVPFCEYLSSGSGPNATVQLDTKIVRDKHTMLLAYRLTVADVSTTTELYGFIFGDTVVPSDSTGKTITLSTHTTKYLRLTIGNFANSPNIKGIIRHI